MRSFPLDQPFHDLFLCVDRFVEDLDNFMRVRKTQGGAKEGGHRVVIGDGPLLDSERFNALLAQTEFTELILSMPRWFWRIPAPPYDRYELQLNALIQDEMLVRLDIGESMHGFLPVRGFENQLNQRLIRSDRHKHPIDRAEKRPLGETPSS